MVESDGIVLHLFTHGDVTLENFVDHVNASQHLLRENLLVELHEVDVRQLRDLLEFFVQESLQCLVLQLTIGTLHDELDFFLIDASLRIDDLFTI